LISGIAGIGQTIAGGRCTLALMCFGNEQQKRRKFHVLVGYDNCHRCKLGKPASLKG
jgi:hypothetical protein